MHHTIVQQNTSVEKTLKINTDNLSSINQMISETPKAVSSAVKQSYAAAVKDFGKSGVVTPVTPKSSLGKNGKTPQSLRRSRNPAAGKPAVSGTSERVIGKQLSPLKQNRNNSERLKAVWVSKLHRDTTEEELLAYVKDQVVGSTTDEYKVRKLVKKDRELSSYTFISFKITCPERMLQTLLDPSKWPSSCQIREFEVDRITSNDGARLSAANGGEPKNVKPTTTVQMKSPLEQLPNRHDSSLPTTTEQMDTYQVIH